MNCYSSPLYTDNILPEKFKLLSIFIEYLNSPKNRLILDVGGSRNYYNPLMEILNGNHVYLLNLDRSELAEIKNSICGNARSLPFQSETLDMVLAFDTLEHLIDPDVFLEEVFRVLKFGGIFILSTPNLSDFYSRIVFLLGYSPFNYTPSKFRVATPISKLDTSMGHVSVFTYKGLNQLLLIHGFKIIKSDGYFYCDDFYINQNPLSTHGVGLYNIRRIINRFLPITMREGMIFLCEKIHR